MKRWVHAATDADSASEKVFRDLIRYAKTAGPRSYTDNRTYVAYVTESGYLEYITKELVEEALEDDFEYYSDDPSEIFSNYGKLITDSDERAAFAEEHGFAKKKSKKQLAREEEQARIDAIVMPTIDAIKDEYAKTTGLWPELGKYYYREDVDGVVMEFWQSLGHLAGYRLCTYNNPSRLSLSSKLIVHLDDYADIDAYADMLVQRLTGALQRYFSNEDFFWNYWPEDIDLTDADAKEAVLDKWVSDDFRIETILDELEEYRPDVIYDGNKVRQFIHGLLDSGEIENMLPQILEQNYDTIIDRIDNLTEESKKWTSKSN